MASVCRRCVLRLQRAAQADTRHLANRSFSSTSSAQRQLPTFTQTDNHELNDVLSTFREKHLIPAYLTRQERKLIYKQKYRQQLEDNPTTALAGGSEVPLRWIDRRREVPGRGRLVRRALDLMFEGNDAKDLPNLPALLQGLKEGVKKPLGNNLAEKLIRKSIESGKFGQVIRCLQQANRTGLTLKNEFVLRAVLCGLHDIAQSSDWSKGATERALRDANVIAAQLESEEHGTGRELAENDPRTRPEVVGVFLELAAVYVYKHADAKDESGLVKAYAERLVNCLEKSGTQPRDVVLEKRGPQWPMLRAIPVWHGLTVAQEILGKDMPKKSVVSQTLANYEIALSKVAQQLEARGEGIGTYDHMALAAWNACIRP